MLIQTLLVRESGTQKYTNLHKIKIPIALRNWRTQQKEYFQVHLRKILDKKTAYNMGLSIKKFAQTFKFWKSDKIDEVADSSNSNEGKHKFQRSQMLTLKMNMLQVQ